MTAVVVMLVMLPILLMGSGFMSGSETALFSLSQQQRASLRRGGGLVALAVETLLAETRSLLITLLFGNMVVNVLYFTISSVVLIKLSELWSLPGWAAALGGVIPLAAIIVFGELMPKLIAGRSQAAWVSVTAVPLLGVHRLLTPIRVLSNVLVITPLARLVAPSNKPASLSSDELEALLSLSRRQGVIDQNEQRLLVQVLELSMMRVRDLMVPRVDIKGYNLDSPVDELLALIRETRLRYLPVYDGSLDQMVGVVSSRRVMLSRPSDAAAVRVLATPVRYVPLQQRAEELMVSLRKGGEPVAVVVDEHGGTAGLVTIEDVVEHVVGELAGGYERDEEPDFERLGEGRFRVDGDLAVHDWPQLFGRGGAEAANLHGAVSTVGGLVMALLGRVPRVGDRVSVGNVDLEVESMDGPRIDRVVAELHDASVEVER